MSKPKRTGGAGTYFVTSATEGRRRVFQKEANALLFVETLQHYRAEGCYLLHGFVVMPDHVHLLLTPQEITLERVMGLIKGGSRIGLAQCIRPGSVGLRIIGCETRLSICRGLSTFTRIL